MVFLDRDMPCRRSTRLRAASVAFYHDFCEISHMPNTCSVVQGCHCLPHCWMNDTFEDLMRVVEYHFGFRYSKSLNLDTRWNIFLLKSDFHNYLDRNGLLVLPLEGILNLVEPFALKNLDLDLGDKILYTTALQMPATGWPYIILNLGLPESHVILRKTLERVQGVWTDTGNSTTYKHPFKDFPIIRSHVHPCFVVLNAYNKLKNLRKYPAHWPSQQMTKTKHHEHCLASLFKHGWSSSR
ncbi:hypothetical protein CPB85DRAFT_1458974 [Mucidula mucida]|nr:hypothetical protein CPB85DRAFT_1458974 [Mucidula mucida]